MSYRRRRQQEPSVAFFIMILIAGIYFTLNQSDKAVSFMPREYSGYALTILVVILGLVLMAVIYTYATARKQSRKLALLQAANIDHMSGSEFETYLAHLLNARGFTIVTVNHARDYGIDLVAKKGGETYSIQAKRYGMHNKVNRRAITDAVAGISYGDCTKAMVITNSYFTYDAKLYADKTRCILVDRTLLAEWIDELNYTK